MAEFNGQDIFSIPGGREYDIVVQAQGSRGSATFVESVPGLVKLYNPSAGLWVNGNGEVVIYAASESEIDKEESKRSSMMPIVPKYLPYAMSKYSYQGDLSKANTELPPGAETVKEFVEANMADLLPLLPAFKVELVPMGGTFYVKPGMMGIAMPANNRTTSKTLQFLDENGSQMTDSLHATTIFFATDKGIESATKYRPVFLFIDGLTSTSYHNSYTGNCRIVNKNDGSGDNSGYAYIFYVTRKG